VTAHERLARRIAGWFGLDLERGGRLASLERVVHQRAESAGYPSADDYVDSLESAEDPEVIQLLDTITVGHTWFFRDAEQTEAIATALRALAPRAARPEVWVAGCSTGEDAYTVALLAAAAGVDVGVLGTDVNPRALERARAARYAEWSTRQVPAGNRNAFARVRGGLVLDAAIAKKVVFERHNLVEAPPRPRHGAGWDVILCRNVLIYFRRPVAARAVERMAGSLRPGGWLFLGASEVIVKAPPGCRVGSIGARVVIQKLPDSEPAPSVESRKRSRAPTPAAPARIEDAIEAALGKLEAGRNDEAIMLCAKVLEEDPLRVEAHLVSGMALHLGRDPESAVRALSAAVLIDPLLWPAFFYLGQALEKLGRHEEAREAYTQADARARAAPARKLGVLDAYKGEIASLARERVQRLGPIPDPS
jgi:chemotaxis protein methyltransferase CheR